MSMFEITGWASMISFLVCMIIFWPIRKKLDENYSILKGLQLLSDQGVPRAKPARITFAMGLFLGGVTALLQAFQKYL